MRGATAAVTRHATRKPDPARLGSAGWRPGTPQVAPDVVTRLQFTPRGCPQAVGTLAERCTKCTTLCTSLWERVVRGAVASGSRPGPPGGPAAGSVGSCREPQRPLDHKPERPKAGEGAPAFRTRHPRHGHVRITRQHGRGFLCRNAVNTAILPPTGSSLIAAGHLEAGRRGRDEERRSRRIYGASRVKNLAGCCELISNRARWSTPTSPSRQQTS